MTASNDSTNFGFGTLEIARRESRLLLTEDKDFGELVFRSAKKAVPGVVLLRIPPERNSLKWDRLRAAVTHRGNAVPLSAASAVAAGFASCIPPVRVRGKNPRGKKWLSSKRSAAGRS